MNNINIRQVQKEDLKELSRIYVQLYDKADIGEHWTEETALQLLEYWYRVQPDLFLCACESGIPVGGVMSGIKPWWDGTHLTDTEIFVSDAHQKKGIATKLYQEHYKLAIEKYNAVIMEAHTYEDENGFPLKWYKQQGFTTVDDLVIISGDVQKALDNLNNRDKEKNNEYER